MEKKELSLSISKKPAKVIAHKRTMNFAYHASTVNWKKLGIIAGVILIVFGVFAKFAIFDQLAIKNQAIQERDAAQSRLIAVNKRMASYNELKAEYDRYSDARMNENERYLVDRPDILNFISDEIMPNCNILTISVTDNTLDLTLSGISLQELSELIDDLYEHELVTHINLENAISEDSDTARINLEILLQKEVATGEEA